MMLLLNLAVLATKSQELRSKPAPGNGLGLALQCWAPGWPARTPQCNCWCAGHRQL